MSAEYDSKIRPFGSKGILWPLGGYLSLEELSSDEDTGHHANTPNFLSAMHYVIALKLDPGSARIHGSTWITFILEI